MMKEKMILHKDTVMAVLLTAGLAGVLFEGGRFLVVIMKWPVILALIVGVVFGIGNDGYHGIKRLIRDRFIPWLKSLRK